MGESSRRKARVALLKDVCAGPWGVETPDAAYLLMSRNNAEDIERMLEALQDINLGRAKRLSEMIRTRSPEAGWIYVTLTQLGTACFAQLADFDEAMEVGLSKEADGFSARNMKWTSLIFGSSEDLHAATQFTDDIAQNYKERPFIPKLAMIQGGPDSKAYLEIPKSDVQTMNLAPALLLFDSFLESIEFAKKMMGELIIGFDGYNEDARSLPEIAEVEEYLEQLLIQAPWAPLFTDAYNYPLWLKPICSRAKVKTSEDGKTTFAIDSDGVQEVMKFLSMSMADLTVNRLLDTEIPLTFGATIRDWGGFLTSGPNVVPAPPLPI